MADTMTKQIVGTTLLTQIGSLCKLAMLIWFGLQILDAVMPIIRSAAN